MHRCLDLRAFTFGQMPTIGHRRIPLALHTEGSVYECVRCKGRLIRSIGGSSGAEGGIVCVPSLCELAVVCGRSTKYLDRLVP